MSDRSLPGERELTDEEEYQAVVERKKELYGIPESDTPKDVEEVEGEQYPPLSPVTGLKITPLTNPLVLDETIASSDNISPGPGLNLGDPFTDQFPVRLQNARARLIREKHPHEQEKAA